MKEAETGKPVNETNKSVFEQVCDVGPEQKVQLELFQPLQSLVKNCA